MNAIGIDMSKDTFHAAFSEHEVQIFKNSADGIDEFLTVLKSINFSPKKCRIGVEATGIYHVLFSVRLNLSGWKVYVINPLESHRMITSGLRNVKTDRHDAIAIRKMTLLDYGYLFTDNAPVLALKALVTQRSALVRMRVSLKQQKHVHAIRENAANMPLHDSFSTIISMLTEEIKTIDAKMQTYALETQSLLKTIPGIGKTTAAALVAFVGDINRFPTPEKLVAYIGMDPRVFQSGTSIKGKGYISKRGSAYLRHVLFNAAFIARQHNPDLEIYYKKKIDEGKHYFSAMCAVERKLIHIIWAVWKRGTPFGLKK
jgi:transposase